MEAIPITNEITVILEPKRLLISISMSPEVMDENEMASSGVVVTMDKTIKPITKSPSFVILANFSADLTTTLLPTESIMMEVKKIKI